MRKDLAFCNKDVCTADGALNLKYFNVKKGHYWSKEMNDALVRGIIKHGAYNSQNKIKSDFKRELGSVQDWSATEIRLRTCKLLRCLNLSGYA